MTDTETLDTSALRKARSDFVECRALRGHAWEQYTPTAGEIGPPMFGVRLSVICIRCGTERHTLYSPHTGEQLSAHYYRYPEGYRDLPGRGDGYDLARYRVEYLGRRRRTPLRAERSKAKDPLAAPPKYRKPRKKVTA